MQCNEVKEVIKRIKNKQKTGAREAMEYLIYHGMHYTDKSLSDIMDTCAQYEREDILFMILRIEKIAPFALNYLYTLVIDKQLTNVRRTVEESYRIKDFAKYNSDIAVYDSKIYEVFPK